MEVLRVGMDDLQWEVYRLTVENAKLREDNPVARGQVDYEAELAQARTAATEWMEALCVKMDDLQWEVYRLTAENANLRENNLVASYQVDYEVELAQARTAATEWMGRTRDLERKLEEKAREAADAEERAGRAETRAAELTDLEGSEDARGQASYRAEEAELRAAVKDREGDLARAQQELGELDAKLEEHERRSREAREAALQKAEIERYRAVEGERQKWEARLNKRLALEQELRAARAITVETGNNGRRRERLHQLTAELEQADNLLYSVRGTRVSAPAVRPRVGVSSRLHSPARQSPSPASGGHGTHNYQTANVDLSLEEQVHRVGGGSGTHSLWTGSGGQETQQATESWSCPSSQRRSVAWGTGTQPHGAVRPSREIQRQNQGEPVLSGLAGCRQNQGEPVLSGGYEYPGSWRGGEAPPMATSTLTGRNPAPMMTNPQGELDQVAATHTTTSASRPHTGTTAQPLPPPQVSDPIHGSIDVGGVGVDTVGPGLGWHQPPPSQRSQGVQENSSERPGVRQPVHSREEDTPSPPRDGEIHSREGHSQDTPSPTRDGEIHSREGHSQDTPSPTREGEIHSREGHSQDTPSPTRDGEIHSRERGTRRIHPRRLERERYTRERGTRRIHPRRLEMERYTRERAETQGFLIRYRSQHWSRTTSGS